MIEFPITELMDEAACVDWLERNLHPTGLVCPHCGSPDRRLFRAQGWFPAYRCRSCDGYYTLLNGVREVHCNTCEGAGTMLRTFLQPLRGKEAIRIPAPRSSLPALHAS
jgi:hypothetical protein